ncbi:MAG TPA: hypothetical protein VIJ55_05730 [Acetobacteraceae bacterium]
MRVTVVFLGLLCLTGCGTLPALSSDGADGGYSAHSQQVQRDVEAITRGMNNARAQSEAVARARTR